MDPIELRFRQIHLDFHTSEKIAGIGSKFDPDEFADTLDKARVNSVTCFGRGHHGWIYFDTEKFPERRHPHLSCNLLKEQIEACHARNIRVPIYVTIQWDHYTAYEHPEWVCVSPEGTFQGTPPYQAGFYRRLCLNSPYVDFLKEHVQEIMETLPTDGFFFDIVHPQDCSCTNCIRGMRDEGLDPSDQEARQQYGLKVEEGFKRDLTQCVRELSSDCTIFYNAGHVGPRHRASADSYSHFELESLPSGGWGYLHFPMAMRYGRTLGLDCMGMTGKFHTSWGDFHSFKNEAALQFECFQMLALNAKCSIGDQLHPEGKICQTTYGLIGSVYSEVEKREPWCAGAEPVTEIGVLTPEEFTGGSHSSLPPAVMGLTRILQEASHQSDIVDSSADFTKYKVLILPDEIPVSEELAEKIEGYLSGGGAVITSYHSGMDETQGSFVLKALGVELKGEAPFNPDFIRARDPIANGVPPTECVMYMRGLEVDLAAGAETLADVVAPYFNRTYEHFCSHRHTPSAGEIVYPGAVKNGNAIYFAHPIFTQYNQNAPRWCKRLFLNALEMLLPDPLVRIEAPTTALTALNEQATQDRLVLHLLHYVPERRGQDFDIIEDVIPIFDVKVSVKAGRPIKSVACVPQGTSLEFGERDGRVEFTVPKVEGHQMVELSYA